MITTSILFIVIAIVALLAAIAALFFFVYRPWQMNWGATADEIARRMAGDAIVEDPAFNATRAVTIDAPPEDIWPWLVQMGYLRAGFYSWDILDNANVPSAERILPEYQDLKIGDHMPLTKNSCAEVVELEPDSHMLLVFKPESDVTWSWGLYEVDGQRTRLVSRLRWQVRSRLALLMLEASEIIMMRKCLLGIKYRSEALTSTRP